MEDEHTARVLPGPTGEKKLQKGSLLLVLLIIFLLLVIGFLAWRLLFPATDARYQADTEAVEGLIPGRSPEEIEALLNQIVEEGMFNVSINGQITVGTDRKGDVCIENIAANHYLMQVDIVVKDSAGTETAVYSSGVLAPGYSIENGTFQILPPVGTVDAVAIFTALDQDTMGEVGHTNVSVLLTRES